MMTEYSCGAVIFTRVDAEIQYVIIQSLEGIYGFPKGHMEPGESEKHTALREVQEETGLTVQILDGFRYVDSHSIPSKPDVTKQITYFLAGYKDQPIIYQKEELLSAQLMEFQDAMNAFQFESSRLILAKAHHFLQNKI